jgi:DNA-binding LacI/PurR family transcriptional regulator
MAAAEGGHARTDGRGPTIYDVATAAGVSHTTVSRAVNGLDGMTAATRVRILELAARVGYEPHATARGLAGRTRPHLAVVTVGGGSPMSARLADGVRRAAQRLGYAIALVGVDAADRRSVIGAAERVGEHGVRGSVVIMNDGFSAELVASLAAGSPSVVLSLLAGPLPQCVGADPAVAVALAADHLRELGHRDRAIVRPDAASRAAGELAAVPADAARSAASGLRLGRDATALRGCTGVIAPSVSFALGLIRGLGERGLRVPKDVSVVSLEDDPDAAYLAPPLTAVGVRTDHLTRRAVELLHRLIDPGAAEPAPDPQPRLVVRASTAPPRGSATGRRR